MKLSFVSVVTLAAASPVLAQTTAGVGATPSATPADEVIVTATRSGDAVPADLVGSSVTVISNRDLEDRQVRILSDALRDVPGVEVDRSGAIGGLTQVRIRGSEADQVLVFIDGIKADDPYKGAFDFGTLITDEAARVEVLRGQQSALYGSDAIGGVVSYTTLSGREAPGISLRGEGGSMGTYDGGARIAGVAGSSFDYALSSSYYHTDGYPVAPGGTRDIGSTLLGATAKLDWTPATNLALTAIGRYSYARVDTDDQDITALSPVVQGYPVIVLTDTPGSYNRNRGLYGRLGATLTLLGGAWTNSVDATIADTVFDAIDAGAPSSGDHGRRWRGSFDSTVRFGSARVANRFTLAADAERQSFRNTSPGGYSDNGVHRIDTLGFVAQYDLTVDDRLALGASARIDSNSRFQDDATYRATASYRFATNTRVHAAYGTGVRNPTATDLFAYASGQFIGNPNLRPERSLGYEAGIEQSLGHGRITLGATYFDNRLHDQIDVTYTLVGGRYLQTTYNETGSTRQRGVETYASARLADFRAFLTYTWLDAPQTVEALAGARPADGSYQFPVPLTIQAVRRPNDIASANLTWAPRRLPVTATLTVRYNGRQNDYAFNGDFNRLIVPLKAYTLVNLDATWTVMRHLQLFGRVENLANDRYQEVFTYNGAGRAAYGGVRVRF